MVYTVRAFKKGKKVFESKFINTKSKAKELAEDIRDGKNTKSGRWAKNAKITIAKF